MLEAVIFDVDGTLIDSVDLHAKAWQRALEHFGYPLPYRDIRNQIGKGGDQLIPFFLPPSEEQRIGAALTDYRSDLYKREYLPQARAFQGVRDLFIRLRADGVRTALASSSKQEELQVYMRLAQIEDLVDAAVSADDIEHSKPAPDVIDVALKQLAPVNRDRVVMVGDSPYDAQAARKAGLRTICLLSGGFTASQLRQAGCVDLFEDPADMLARYSSWRSPPMPPPRFNAPSPAHR
jgi:beta-phosphoglucomutase-like phosphatase (HAD superfamily)